MTQACHSKSKPGLKDMGAGVSNSSGCGKHAGPFQDLCILFLAALVVLMGTFPAWFTGLFGSPSNTKCRMLNMDFRTLDSALESYRIQAGSFPGESQGLDALVKRPLDLPSSVSWRQVMNTVPNDPWDSSYIYRVSGKRDPSRWELISKGPDGLEGTADDMSSQDD